MRLSLGSALADAAALWRAERDLIVRIAGVFYFLPIFALALLASGISLPEQATQDQIREVLREFYGANFVWLLLITIALEFGSLALLKLFLQGGETVRDLLQAAAIRLVPFVLLGFANGATMQLGFTLFILPGIYVFGRTWMMGAAYAAEPERGLLRAVERGFRLSTGNGWRIAILGFGVAATAGAGAMVLLILAQAGIAAAGGAQWAQALLILPVAAATAAHAAFTLVRIAAYRRLAGSNNGI